MPRQHLTVPINPLCLIGVPICLIFLLSGCHDGSPGKTKSSHTINVDSGSVTLSPPKTSQILVSRLQPEKQLRIFNQEEARLIALPCREGLTVYAEDIIVPVDDTLLKMSLNKAQNQSRQAQLDLQRCQALAKKKLASQYELASAEQERLETRQQHAAIRAPFSGVVTQRPVEQGDVVEKRSHLLSMKDVSRLRIEADISELLDSQIKPAQHTGVRITDLGEHWIAGTLNHIFPSIDSRAQQGRLAIVSQFIFTKLPGWISSNHLQRFFAINSDVQLTINEGGKPDKVYEAINTKLEELDITEGYTRYNDTAEESLRTSTHDIYKLTTLAIYLNLT